MSLFVLDAGLATRIVDEGRPATRHLGVPLGGAADRAALALANALVGNSPTNAALEIGLKGPILRVEVDLTVALVGAPFVVISVHVSVAGCQISGCRTGESSSRSAPAML